MNNGRISGFDVLKALAIISVVAYHMGEAPYGYLGVDVFLVVNGYLLARHFQKLQTLGDAFNFIIARIIRLWPIVIVASIFCLLWGCVWLLPFTYRGVVREVIASNIFCSNFLSYLTTQDYWDAANETKPLMHTWYLGILVQFYVLFSIIVVTFKKILPDTRDWSVPIVCICAVASLGIFVLPDISASAKFYFVPFRVYEFCAGMLVALHFRNERPAGSDVVSTWMVIIAYALLSFVILSGGFHNNIVNVVFTCVLTSVLLAYLPYISQGARRIFHNEKFSLIGKMSLSIYIWHQVVLAFCRCAVDLDVDFTGLKFIAVIGIILLFSSVSYHYFENKVQNRYFSKNDGLKSMVICICAALPVLFISSCLYQRAGVLRNVPELGVEMGNVTPSMHCDYNEKIYEYNRDFSQIGKARWLITGDSFARDWCNILREAGVEDAVELSYSRGYNVQRMKDADVIFKTMGTIPEIHQSSAEEFLTDIERMGISQDKVFIVGGKMFGRIDPVYVSRFYSEYPDVNRMTKIHGKYFYYNDNLRHLYKSQFIDLMTPVCQDGTVRVFTDDGKFISHDCKHLTEFGAKYYAKLLKLQIGNIVKRSKPLGE